jgi:RimJ/RimL family protein N-acetyltransferase
MAKRVICSPEDKVRIGEWVYARTGGRFVPEVSQAIGLEKDGVLIAGAVYERYNGASMFAHLAIDDKRALTREFIRFNFQYAFNQIKVKKLVGLVSSANEAAIKLDKHFGYELEAVIKDGAPDGDMLVFTMTPEQCKYLKD